jgi:murein L,D-transpeptidase YafK
MRLRRCTSAVLFFLLTAIVLPALSAGELMSKTVAAQGLDISSERVLIRALDEIRDNQVDEALVTLEYLLKFNPEFRLAQLIYADLLMARTRPITDFGQPSFVSREQVEGMRKEAQARWRHFSRQQAAEQVPAELVQLSPDQVYAVVVDLQASRLYLYENKSGSPLLLDSFYASIGKNGIGKLEEGDQKTPVGVYFVTGFIPSSELPDLYGSGAFPIDYPNPWDQRHGRTGYGIWLHGTPSNTYSRPPLDSDGCVILSNGDLDRLRPYLEAGETPVILAESVNWISRTELEQRRKDYHSILNQWRLDWESRDAAAYLQHYSREFEGEEMDYRLWTEHKKRVNSSKQYINIGLDRISMFYYPGESDMLVVTFEQDYDSDNFQARTLKRQYWRKETDGEWRIVYEGTVS